MSGISRGNNRKTANISWFPEALLDIDAIIHSVIIKIEAFVRDFPDNYIKYLTRGGITIRIQKIKA